METKHKKKGCIRPTVCVNCEPKVKKFSKKIFLVIGLLALVAIGFVVFLIINSTTRNKE